MKLVIDTDARTFARDGAAPDDLLSEQAFRMLTDLWVRVGWNRKYSYGFSWFGRPIMQLPEDMIRIQEVIWRVQPDVIVETGVAHGGSLIFYASLLKAIGHGRVIGIDIDIRAHNRAAIEAHPLSGLVTLHQGSSTDDEVVASVKHDVGDARRVLVLLDSNHSYAHVTAEIEAYAALVTVDSYLVVTDGVMEFIAGDPRAAAGWATDNPRRAAIDFAKRRDDFKLETPEPGFSESMTPTRATYWPDAYLRRVR
jgi:cephalosporin hydroxylase